MGHKSIAEAIEEKILAEARDRYEVKTFFYKPPFFDFYSIIYRFAPQSFGKYFDLTSKVANNNEEIDRLVREYFRLSIRRRIFRFLKENKSDLIINSYLQYSPSLAEYQKKFKVPFFNVVADPRTPHPIVFAQSAIINFIFDRQIEHPRSNDEDSIPAGWFVKKPFEKDFDKNKLRQKLKIKDQLTILISSGSDGSNMVMKMLPSIINCPKNVNFFIACGKNKTLLHNIEGIKRSVESLSSSKAKIIPLGFTKEMYKYMQAADLVVGKAGPNSLFESVATLTPFFAITHIAGQEDGNLDLIKEHQLGIVEENSKKANKILLDFIKHPEKLKEFDKPLKKMKEYNQGSIDILLKEIDRELS